VDRKRDQIGQEAPSWLDLQRGVSWERPSERHRKSGPRRERRTTGKRLGVQMIDHSQGVKFVDAGCNLTIFNVRQAAQVDDEVGTAPLAGQLIAGSLHVPEGQPEAFPRPAQLCSRLKVLSRKIFRIAQTPDRHSALRLSVTFPEQRLIWRQFPRRNRCFPGPRALRSFRVPCCDFTGFWKCVNWSATRCIRPIWEACALET